MKFIISTAQARWICTHCLCEHVLFSKTGTYLYVGRFLRNVGQQRLPDYGGFESSTSAILKEPHDR